MLKQELILFLMAVVVLPPACRAAEFARSWQEYFFDGTEFHEGASSSGSSIYIKDGHLPVIKTENVAPREDRLEAGTGGLVILCYIQTAGGKLQNHAGYVPLAGAAIEIKSGGQTITTRSNGAGYSILALAEGKYDIQVRGLTRKALIAKGKAIFVTIRAGKRMAD